MPQPPHLSRINRSPGPARHRCDQGFFQKEVSETCCVFRITCSEGRKRPADMARIHATRNTHHAPRTTSSAPNTLIDKPKPLHLLRVKKISAVEQDRVR